MRARVATTRWPEKETVADESQGVQSATIQALADYWASDYDWRKCEAKLNAPTAVHDRDRRPRHSFHSRQVAFMNNALPLIITHGWPGSVIEMLKRRRPAH